MCPANQDVTELLVKWRNGDSHALEELTPLVYEELRRLAKHYLRRERMDHTLQSAALVNEAYLRIVDQSRVTWQSRSHFYGVAAQMIRRILVDYARARQTVKRGEAPPKLSLDEAIGAPSSERDVNVVALDDALSELAKIDPQQSRIVELRYFTGLSVEETAEVLGVSAITVKRHWTLAKAWLKRELSEV